MAPSHLHDRVHLGERLRLEPLEPHHADALFEGLQSARIYDFIADQPPVSIEALRTRYRRLASRQSPDGTQTWLNWAVWSRVEATFIGYVQATITPDRRAVLAYVFFPNAWGKGYAKEAVGLMIAHLADIEPDLEFRACVDVRNQGSIALLRNLGFSCAEVRKDAEVINGFLSDEAEYRLSSGEYRRLRAQVSERQ